MAYSTIPKPSDYFEATTYTGGATDVSSLSFQPDFVWAKKRDGDESHGLFDAVRGATKALKSNSSNSEDTRSGSLTSFDNDGWSMGGSDGIISASGSTYVGWAWKAGTGQGSSNTAGSINTTYTSVNTTAGFSISKYTGNQTSGATVGHGLGAVPAMFIVKNLNDSESWQVYHKNLTSASYHLVLNDTGAQASNTSRWNGVAPTNQVFTLGNNDTVNNVNIPYIAYCFAEKKGYSKFGSYIANNDNDGPFVYTGFAPKFIMIKGSNNGGEYKSWCMFDTTRQPFNLNVGKTLYANKDYQEGKRGQGTSSTTIPGIDILSNGFKLKMGNDEINTSTDSYIYAAFAEQPLVANSGTDGVPATAR